MTRRVSLALPPLCLFVTLFGLDSDFYRNFGAGPVEAGLPTLVAGLFPAWILRGRSHGLLATFGPTAITERSSATTIDAVQIFSGEAHEGKAARAGQKTAVVNAGGRARWLPTLRPPRDGSRKPGR